MLDKDMDKKVKQIYEASIQILEEVGFLFRDNYAIKVLKENGIKVEGNMAYFTREQVEHFVSMAPSEFEVVARNEINNIHVSTTSRHIAPIYGPPKIRNFDGTVRLSTLDDYIKISELVEVCDYLSLNGGILAQPNDVDVDLSYQIMTYASLLKSEKCLYGFPHNYKIVKQLLDILAIGFGGEDKLKESPKTITIIDPIDLTLDSNCTDSMRLLCEYNQALFILPGIIAGGTGPITMPGALAMNHAACLATIAFAQMLKAGTPVIYCSVLFNMDMTSGYASQAGPEYAFNAKYGAAMAKYHNLPCRTAGSHSDASGVTAQAGYESMMNLFEAFRGGTNLIMQGVGVLDSVGTFSYEKMMVDIEILSMLHKHFKEVEVNEKTLAVDVIKDVVQNKKSFLTHKHTYKNCRTSLWAPEISIRQKSQLTDTPENLLKEKCDKKMEKMLDKYVRPSMSEDIEEKLTAYMRELGVDEEVLNKIRK